jgi:hypothetical protein
MITLTDENRKDIMAITATITTVPRYIIEATQDDIFATLENTNPLNRLLKDPETGEVIGFLAVEDVPSSTDEKIAYLKYAATLPKSMRPSTKIQLEEEIQKLLTRAKKKGYTRIEFDGFNPALNRLLKRYGFEETERGVGQANFYSIQLDRRSAAEKETDEAMDFLYQNAPKVMEKLSEIQKSHLRNTLSQAYQHHIDPKINELYGAIFTLQQHQETSLLDTPFTISKLYEHVRIVQK